MRGPATAPPDDGGTSVEDFLASSSSDTGEQIERIGHVLGLLGVTLSLGVVIALLVVLRDERREHRALLRVVGAAGLLLLAGGVVEIAGLASAADQSWANAFDGEIAAASMLRIMAGLMIALGFVTDGEGIWRPDAGSAFGLAGLLIGVLSFGFDGHTVTEGLRGVHMAVNAAHVLAGGAWFGGVVALVVVAVIRRRRGEPSSIGQLVVRFSSVASVALIVVTVAGVLMTLMIIDDTDDLTGTSWGRTLLVKLVAVAVVVMIGSYNHFVVVPKLERSPDDAAATQLVRGTLAIEAFLLIYVVIATAFLIGASPN